MMRFSYLKFLLSTVALFTLFGLSIHGWHIILAALFLSIDFEW